MSPPADSTAEESVYQGSTAGELEIYSLAMAVFKTSTFQAGGRHYLELLVQPLAVPGWTR